MSGGVELLCYNKGCGKSFKEEDNNEDSCCYHPGDPVFHDAMKGWSCCKKRSTDFTDFLNMPGCTKSKHNPVKPVIPVKTPVKPLDKGEVIEVKPPPAPRPKVPIERPSSDEPHVDLKVAVSNSLKNSLARFRKSEEEKQKASLNNPNKTTVPIHLQPPKRGPPLYKGQNSWSQKCPLFGDTEDEEVPVGTKCFRNGCETTYTSSETNLTDCFFHPGIPIFHEGYKFWSCCRKRTSDFNEFLKQEGCKTGNHSWKACENSTQLTRCDWHQTGSQIVISVFAKCCVPEECHFTANSTSVNCHISYEGGKKEFQKMWNLEGVIEPSNSNVELLGTKAEIKLRKSDGTPWKWLEIRKEEKVVEENRKTDNNDDS